MHGTWSIEYRDILTNSIRYSIVSPLNLSLIFAFLFLFPTIWEAAQKEVQRNTIMKLPSILEMLQAGVHFGHQKSRWHPKMADFIFTERHGVHIIDLEKTQAQLETVLAQVTELAAQGKRILFVSTKPQAKQLVQAAAQACGMPYLVDRWIGGMLTNFTEIKRLITKYNHQKEQQANGELEKYTKKEQITIGKDLEKMDLYLAGLSTLDRMPDVLFVPAVQREKSAIVEANKTNVPVIGVCDTNANPKKITYVIPSNDDAVRSIEMMVNLVSAAISEGVKEFEKRKSLAEKKTVTEKLEKTFGDAPKNTPVTQ
jgi:small subunit ribosomal protein S2